MSLGVEVVYYPALFPSLFLQVHANHKYNRAATRDVMIMGKWVQV